MTNAGETYKMWLRAGMIALMISAVILLLLTLKGLKVYPALTGPGFAGRNARGGKVAVGVCNTTVTCAYDAAQRADVPCNQLLAPVDPMRSNLIIKRWLPPECSKAALKTRTKGCKPLNDKLTHWLLQNAAEKLNSKTGATCDDVQLSVRYEEVKMSVNQPTERRTTVKREYRLE